MKSLLKPHWILVFIILPQVLLAILYSSALSIISSLLQPENIRVLTYFTIAFATGLIGSLAYTSILVVRKKKVQPLWFGLVVLTFYITFLFLYFNNFDVLPWDIPQWMVSRDELFKYLITCLMPPLIYGILLLVIHFTPEEKSYKAWVNFVNMAAIPFGWYVLFMVFMPIVRTWEFHFEFILVIIYVASAVAFIFFLIRGIYVISLRKKGKYKKFALVVRIIFALIMPITGLIVNETFFKNDFFGDFTHWGFHVLAVFNGILFCIPRVRNVQINLLIFFLKCATLPFTLYFFLVFLPFLPLSIVAIIVVGLGFLMLTPSILFVIHIQDLCGEINILKKSFAIWKLNLLVAVGFLALPAIVTFQNLYDRNCLHEALNYVYEPDFNAKTVLDLNSVKSVLNHIHENKERRFNFIRSQTPYLSSYYNWLVLDNLTLSNEKLRLMEQVFVGESSTKVSPADSIVKDVNVAISEWTTTTNFDLQNKCWKTWINLDIKNSRNIQGEYISKIHLPEGCWINNYYLYVNGKKKFGLLAEKKSAQWIYNQIRSVRKDPGILYYTGSNEVMFRVFPFRPDERRKTGIEFLHYEPMEIEIDGNKIKLGKDVGQSKSLITKNAIYIPSSSKALLPKVNRTPYIHFIVDCSTPDDASSSRFLEATFGKAERLKNAVAAREKHLQLVSDGIRGFLNKKMIPEENSLISFTDFNTNTFDLKDNWQQKFLEAEFRGGFFLGRTIKKALIDNYIEGKKSYPVFVVISDKIEKSLNSQSFEDISFTYPEGDDFYAIAANGELNRYSFLSDKFTKPIEENVKEIPVKRVHEWTNESGEKAYLAADGEGAIVISELDKVPDEVPSGTTIEKATALESMTRKMSLIPNETDNLWLAIIKGSFASKIMTSHTSYLVVENEAQEKALFAKQHQILNAKKSLDLDKEVRMTEPELWIILALFGAFLIWKNRKKWSYS